MAIAHRNTVMAVVPETTEGTPLAPSAATQYTALQEDISVEPSFNELVNNELRSSIGESQVILGIEQPKMSFSHYLRPSGTEGVSPDFDDVLKSLFGTQATAGTEYPLVSGSSVSVVNVNTGIGANFARGQAMLFKDQTNGWSIRPVLSIATDALTLGFNLANAPATGVNTGKAITFSPAQSGHQALSLWVYRGNGGAVELMAGGRVTGMTATFQAGDLINANYSMEGIAYSFDPIKITTATSKLDFLDNAATRAITVPAKIYKDPTELADKIAQLMNALGSANTFTCVYSNTSGKFTITSNGSTLTLKWNTGTNTANSIASVIGFSTGADSSAALTYTSATALSFASPYTPTFDNANPLAAKNNELFIGDATDVSSISAQKFEFKFTNSREPLMDVSAESGMSGSLITKREIVMNVIAYLTQADASKFTRFRKGQSTSLLYNFGNKTNTNWVAGQCGCVYCPTATISAFKLGNLNGVVTLEMELKAMVDSSGNGEFYLNFL